tara:strand:+ start:32560 stop:32802 length:243 start_codon:yes stop_codon:yes gene_type:complete
LTREKRKGDKPIPNDIHNYLNEDQQAVLDKIQDFDWNLKFVHRPLFQQPVIVAVNNSGQAHAVLEDDGHFNTEADILLRE